MTYENAVRLLKAAKVFASCLTAAEIINLEDSATDTTIAAATHLEAAFTEVGSALDAIDGES